MKVKVSVLLLAAAAALTAAPVPDAGARKLLQKYAEAGKSYSPRSGRSHFFARAQLKYGLERSDYLHRWTDFPLLQNSRLKQYNDGSFVNPEAWKIMADTIRKYDIDGFAFFPSTKGRMDLFKKAVTPGYSVSILPELILGQGMDKVSPVIDAALANPNVLRINGKILLTTYPGTANPAFWVKLKKDLTVKYGDKFLLLPMHTLPVNMIGQNVKKLTASGVEKLAQIIRNWLRCVDGYYYNYPPLNEFRRYDAAFDRDVMIPLLRGILSEPEFRHKYLAWGTKVGHENYYEKGSFTYNSGGTSMLRGSVGSAVAAGADVINLVEWDEENENTSFRPTVANSFSTQRMMRYFSSISKGKLPEPLPGDDPDVPNVILSFRRSLAAGETLTLEVVNIPEKGRKTVPRPVRLTLKDRSGSTVRTFNGKLNSGKLDELRFNVKTADVLDHHVLIPELNIAGKTWIGFTPIELRANCNTDNKWVKQPIRDLISGSASLKLVETLPDGRVKIAGKISSPVPLHYVSVCDSGSQAYIHNADPRFQENENRIVIKLYLACKPRSGTALSGSIRIRNAKDLVCTEYSGKDKRYVITRPDGWDLPGRAYPSNFNTLLLVCSMERASAANAVFEIATAVKGKSFTAQLFNGSIPAAEIIKKNHFSVSGKGMSLLLLHRNAQPLSLPEGIGQKEVQFSTICDPVLPQSVFFIEAIDINGKTFRSAPVTAYKPSGVKAPYSAFDFFGKKAVTVTCDRNLLTVHKMEISPRYGTVVKNTAGNGFTGIGGNMAALTNSLYMAGENNYYSSLVINRQRKMTDDLDSAPQLITDSSGKSAWRFNGSQNVSFPAATLYSYSGFELDMEVTPTDLSKTRTLFSSGHAGFTLMLRNGVPTAQFYRGNVPLRNLVSATGKKLAVNKKSRIKVRFNQKTLQIFVDGTPGKAVPCSGYQLYPQAVSVGLGVNNDGFCGEISHLEIKPL